MIRLKAGFQLIALSSAIGCGGGTIYPESGDSPVIIEDTRPTAASHSDTGRIMLEVNIVGGVLPDAPVMFSIDNRPPEALLLPRYATTYFRTYDGANGAHQFAISLAQSTCDVNGAAPAPDSVRASSRFTLTPGSVTTIYVNVDCSSVLSRWGARDTTDGAHPFSSLTLRLTSADFGTRDVELPANGSVNFGPIHVGWYHIQVLGIPSNCWGTGRSVPIPFGRVGDTSDSVRIGGVGGVLFYSFHCP